MLHWYNLAAKETGLECTCVNNDNFTVLVSGSCRHCCVSMCTVWVSHSKWLSKDSNESASNFALNLNVPPQKLFGWFRRLQLWATGDWQLHHSNTPAHASHHAEFFSKTSNHPGDLAPLQPRFGALKLLAFPKTKITSEREEISDSRCNSGKYDRPADGNWENCVRSQGTYFERDWGVIVLCTMFLVSCIFFSKCFCFSNYIAGYFLDRPHKCFNRYYYYLGMIRPRDQEKIVTEKMVNYA